MALRNYSISLPKYKAESILFLLLRYMYVVYFRIKEYDHHISNNFNKKAESDNE